MVEIRRLGLSDEAVVERLATRETHVELLADERTFFLVAYDDGEPAGFALTNAANAPAMALYAAAGGRRPNDDDVLWELRWSAER